MAGEWCVRPLAKGRITNAFGLTWPLRTQAHPPVTWLDLQAVGRRDYHGWGERTDAYCWSCQFACQSGKAGLAPCAFLMKRSEQYGHVSGALSVTATHSAGWPVAPPPARRAIGEGWGEQATNERKRRAQMFPAAGHAHAGQQQGESRVLGVDNGGRAASWKQPGVRASRRWAEARKPAAGASGVHPPRSGDPPFRMWPCTNGCTFLNACTGTGSGGRKVPPARAPGRASIQAGAHLRHKAQSRARLR
mgnify:CR=1 FL=1